MTHDPRRRVVPKHPLDTARSLRGSVGDNHHAGMLRIADPDAAAVMQRDPRRPAGTVEQRIEQRPVGHRIRAVAHRFGFAVRARNRAAVEMIAADDDRRLQFAARHHFIERQAQPVAIAKADPADPRRQPLELDPRPGHVEPVVKMLVVGHQFLDLGVGAEDVFGIPRERRPPERPDAAAEQRTDVGRNEAREIERVLQSHVLRHLADVVAIVERGNALGVKIQHGLDVADHGGLGRRFNRFRIGAASWLPLGKRPSLRQVTVDRIVRAGLVGDDVRPDATAHQFGKNIGGIAEQADRDRLLALRRLRHDRERLIKRAGLPVEVTGAQPHLDAARLALDREHRRTGHRRGKRLGAAHAAETRGQDPLARQAAAVMTSAHLDERFIGPLHDALAADVDPRSGRHLAEHHQPLPVQFVEVIERRPVRHQVRVRDQHARRIGMGTENSDRLARLHHQRLVAFELAQ